MMNRSHWYIWSIEHNAWWCADHQGYTRSEDERGIYPYNEACKIVANANQHLPKGHTPNEAMIFAHNSLV